MKRFGRFGERADLIDLEKESVGGDGFDGLFDADGVGAEQIVAEGQGAGVDGLAEARPVGPVVFREAILDADDGELAGPFADDFDHAARIEGEVVEEIAAVGMEVCGGEIDGQGDILAGGEAGVFD